MYATFSVLILGRRDDLVFSIVAKNSVGPEFYPIRYYYYKIMKRLSLGLITFRHPNSWWKLHITVLKNFRKL
jgi:hypothetical protein